MRISASQERGNYPDFGSVVSSNAGEYGKGLPLEQAKEFIDNIDLTLVIERLVKVDGGWTKNEALEAAEQYRRFLYLKKKYANHHKFPPSYDIDEVWKKNEPGIASNAIFIFIFPGYLRIVSK